MSPDASGSTAHPIRAYFVGLGITILLVLGAVVTYAAIRHTSTTLASDRLQQQLGLPDDPGQFRLDAGGGHDLLEVGQPAAVALAAEGDGIGFAGVEPVHERIGGDLVGVVVEPVVLVNRHVCLP